MSSYNVVCADVIDWAKNYDGPPFHALLCDPPYELGFMNKDFDKTGISFRPDTWAVLAEHLHPGGFGMAFASARGWHRLATAIEDAGLRIFPSIFCWANAQSFPKATRIGKSGNHPEWEGHRYGLQLLKNAVEPIIVFQKPYAGKPVDCITRIGAGALNIEQARITQIPHDLQGDAVSCKHEIFHGIQEWLGMPFVGRESYLCFFDKILAALRCYNTDDKDPLRGSDVLGDIQRGDGHQYAHIILSRLFPNGVWCGLNVTQLPNFRCDCLACRRLCDALFHDVQGAAQGGAPLLADVLERICTALSEPFCNPWKCSDHLSTLDDLDPLSSLADLLYGALNVASIPQLEHQRKHQNVGRWPSNFCLVHAPGCQRTGTRRVRGDKRDGSITNTPARSWKNQSTMGIARQGHADADGLETVAVWSCVPECAVRKLGEQSGESRSSGNRRGELAQSPARGWAMKSKAGVIQTDYNDKGTAARFFYNADWQHEIAEQLAQADPVFYVAKASRKERDAGLDCEPRKVATMGAYRRPSEGRTADKNGGPKRNPHPCIKPIKLCTWLATLLLPPAEYAPRRILVPFGGVMSEAIGCLLAGWNEIVAIDMSDEYCTIGAVRLAHWAATMREPRQMGLPDPPR